MKRQYQKYKVKIVQMSQPQNLPQQTQKKQNKAHTNLKLTKRKSKMNKKLSDLCLQGAFHKLIQNDQKSPLPKLIMDAYQRNLQIEESQTTTQSFKFILQPIKMQKDLEEYERVPSYIRQSDWRIDEKEGGAILYNRDKKSIISKLITYICKRVIKTGSFMGISFPTFGMKPQSILQTYCKCLGVVPIIMQQLPSSPLSRIKALNAIILTISLQFNDIQKSFNPVFGQTFQGYIGGYKVYAQQTCHHPPKSSFILYGNDYVLHATLQLNASLGINSAVGIFYGQLTMQFKDGGIVKGRMPNGLMSGMVFGQTKFKPQGAIFSYDHKNKLVCSLNIKQKDIFVGCIGMLRPHAQTQFFKLVETESKSQKYENFKHIPQKQFKKIQSKVEAVWSSHINYDNKAYICYKQKRFLPIKLTQNVQQFGQTLLKSDSCWRKDIKLRAELNMEESQKQKQILQDQERRYRKLRQKHLAK